MAYSQDGGGKQRHRRRRDTRSPSLSDALDWEPEPYPAHHSLPYRTRSRTAEVDIQMPDSASRRTRPSVSSSSHRGRRASEDLYEIMPSPTTTNSYRARAVPHRRPREPRSYEDDEEVYSLHERRSRPQVRGRARPRSQSESESESSSSSRGEPVMTPSTPSRSARINNSTPDSKHSSGSPSRARHRSVESAASLSTQGEVTEILRHGPDEIEVTIDSRTPSRHRRRRRREEREPIYEEPPPIARHVVPVERIEPRHHHRSRRYSESRSGSRRRPRHHRDHHDDIPKSSSSKRCVIMFMPCSIGILIGEQEPSQEVS